MYVPPDEAVQDLGEINMVFDDGNLTTQHTGAGEEVTSAVNPIYQEYVYMHFGYHVLRYKD